VVRSTEFLPDDPSALQSFFCGTNEDFYQACERFKQAMVLLLASEEAGEDMVVEIHLDIVKNDLYIRLLFPFVLGVLWRIVSSHSAF